MYANHASKWTSGGQTGGGVGAGPASGEGGTVTFKSPTGAEHNFIYVQLGYGASASVSFLKSVAIPLPAGFELPSTSSIYVLDSHTRGELTARDFIGHYVYAAVNASSGVGAGAIAMLFGIPPEKIEEELIKVVSYVAYAAANGQMAVDNLDKQTVSVIEGFSWLVSLGGNDSTGQVMRRHADVIAKKMQSNAKGVMLFAGVSSGMQFGVGATAGVGTIFTVEPPTIPVPDPIPQPVPKPIPMRVEETTLKFTLPTQIAFVFSKSTPTDAGVRILMDTISSVKAFAPTGLIVVGHTDSIGTRAKNLDLSKRRAHAIAEFYAEILDLDRAKIHIEFYGESRPIAPNRTKDGRDDPVGRAKNRRVEITFVK